MAKAAISACLKTRDLYLPTTFLCEKPAFQSCLPMKDSPLKYVSEVLVLELCLVLHASIIALCLIRWAVLSISSLVYYDEVCCSCVLAEESPVPSIFFV